MPENAMVLQEMNRSKWKELGAIKAFFLLAPFVTVIHKTG